MKKILLITGIFMNICVLQAQIENEFIISASGGISALHYKSEVANASTGFGGSFGAGYVYFFNDRWGISTGIEAALYRADAQSDNLHVEYPIATPAGLQGNFFLRANYERFKETHSTILLQIPVMLQFQVPVTKKFGYSDTDLFYVAAGFKLAFPVSAKYNQSSTSVTTSGYSDYTEQTYERMPNHGFTAYESVKSSGSLDFGLAYMLAFECGMKWHTSGKNFLYTGIYSDYGLNNINKEDAHELLVYTASAPSEYRYNSFLQSQSGNQPLVDKVSLFAIGIKLKWSF
ncbi:MAG: outer membrane beta-barrel protein [Prevotellaceae bacterium]|nr:outer membrane beta-barrel protein [Prevotellaceae bacterium]